MRWFWFRFNIQNTKPYTIIWNITSALLPTQYAENTYPLTFPSNKSAPSVPRLCCCFFSLHCSRAFIMFLPLAHTIKMCCSDTCISAKVILQGCQNTLSYCHEHWPFFFHWKALWHSGEKMTVHKFIIIGCILFEKNLMSVTIYLFWKWFLRSLIEKKMW